MAPPTVSSAEQAPLISDLRLSTVVPACITSDGINHQFTNTDLAFKLHYISTVHLFTGDAAKDLTIADLKGSMFNWLHMYYGICGRIRRHESDREGAGGRPFLKCNDSGVRIVEAMCSKTVAEWITTVDGGDYHRLLTYHQPFLADNFEFTPLVFLQLTRFKCGGLCVGMGWAHILGDGFTAVDSINTWGKFLAGEVTASPLTTSTATVNAAEPPSASPFRSVKQLQPLANNVKMQTHTFHLSEKQIRDLLSAADQRYENHCLSSFEIISAVVWKALAEIKSEAAEIITVIKKGKRDSRLLGNKGLEIGIVEASQIRDSDPLEIAKMISERFVDETRMIEEGAEWDRDFLIYGSNLTFVDLEEVNLYGLKLKGRDAVLANVSVGGVGDEGAVVVVPAPENGRTVNTILPEDQTEHLKNVLLRGIF